MMLEYGALSDLIRRHPDRGDLSVSCVLAFCMAESSFGVHKIKYESHYRWLVGKEETLSIGELLGQKHSWGLMQVMGAVAREYGHKGPFTDLWEPSLNLKYGMMHLRKLYRRHQHWPDTIAAYNAGTPTKIDGRYKNQTYVNKVLTLWSEYDVKERERASA